MIYELPIIGAINTRDIRQVTPVTTGQTTIHSSEVCETAFSIYLADSPYPRTVSTLTYPLDRIFKQPKSVSSGLDRSQVERLRADLLQAWAQP
jgi:hypothetical protein